MKNKSKVSNINHLSADEFNKLYPIGTKVKYFPIRTNPADFLEVETTSPAWELGSGAQVVCLSHGTGGYSFDNIEVLKCD